MPLFQVFVIFLLCSGKLASCYYGIKIKPHSPLFSTSGTEVFADPVMLQSASNIPPPLPYCPRDLLALRSSPAPSERSQLSVSYDPKLNEVLFYPPSRSLSEQLPPLPQRDHQPTPSCSQRLQSEPLPQPPPLPKPRQLSLHSKLH